MKNIFFLVLFVFTLTGLAALPCGNLEAAQEAPTAVTTAISGVLVNITLDPTIIKLNREGGGKETLKWELSKTEFRDGEEGKVISWSDFIAAYRGKLIIVELSSDRVVLRASVPLR